MKKSILSLFILLLMVVAISNCGKKSVEMSAEMQDFISMIKGSSVDVSQALVKYGANQEIIDNDMAIYDLKEPNVTAKEGDCYTTEFTDGNTIKIYNICWKDGKIAEITEK
jgi:hypothetical protein